MRPDQALASQARLQHGVFTRGQAIAAGLTEKAIQNRLTTVRWIRLSPGVYSAAAAPETWERDMAAALLSRPGSVAAGESAAYLHRFADFGPGRPTVMTGPEANARLGIGRVIRVSEFGLVAKTRVRGFPVTTVAETLWTIARTLPERRISDLVDQQVAMGGTSPDRLGDVLARVEGTRQRGIAVFRRAVLRTDPAAHSTASTYLEVALYRLVSQPGIPAVTRQHPFMLREPSRVDSFIPAWTLVVEADGRNWHTRQSDFQRDRARDNALAARGIVVLRFTYDDLTRRFDTCLNTLLETGRHRRAMNTA